MSTVTCYECKKTYNYQEDGFCPRCGSFNQPRRGSYIVDANGDIVRTDGINEAVAPRTGEYFGVPRLKELYLTSSLAKEDPETFIRKTFNAVDDIAKTPGGEGQEDDQTIVLINHI